MSVFRIIYRDGKKVMLPVNDRAEYMALRDSEQNRRAEKQQMLQCNYSCLPHEDGLLRGSKTPSNTVGMDIDEPIDTDFVLSKKDELGLLMFENSATKPNCGHIVFRRHPELSQEENLKWASSVLGVAYDKGAKDITRVFFTPADKLVFLDDEIFVNEPSELSQPSEPSQPSLPSLPSLPSQPSEPSASSPALPYNSILPAFFKMVAPTFPDVPEGTRNDTVFGVVTRYLRYCTDHSFALIKQLLWPDYSFGLSEAEIDSIIRSALARDRSLTPKVVQEVLRRYSGKGEPVSEAEAMTQPYEGGGPYPSLESCILDEVQMPQLPRWLNTLLKVAPPGYKFPALTLAVPAMDFLMTDVTRKFGTKAPSRLNAWSHLDGYPTANKKPCMAPVLELIKPVQEIDDENQRREDEYFEKCDAAKNKKEQPKPPTDIVIRIMPPNTTRLEHIKRMYDAKGKHTFTCCDEVSSMRMAQGGQYTNREDFMRYLFDNSMVGNQSFVRNSLRCRVAVAWNIATEGTRDQTLATWSKHVTNGGATRVFFVLVPDALRARMPHYVQYSDEDEAYIRRASNIMMQLNGRISTPKIDRELNEWVEKTRQESLEDDERLILKNRSADIAHNYGVTMQLAWVVQQIMDQEDREGRTVDARDIDLNDYTERQSAVDLAVFAADKCLEAQYRLWAKTMREQLNAAYAGVSTFKQDSNYVALPAEPFTYDDLAVLFPGRKANTLRKMIERLKNAGKVRETGEMREGMKLFAKC